MRQKVMAVGIITALLMTAMIYTSPSGDSISESQPSNLLITSEDNLIIFPKGGGYDESYWMKIHADYSIVEASINLIGLDMLDSTQPGLYALVSSDINDDVSTDPQVVTDIYNDIFVAWTDTGAIQGSKAGVDIFIQQWDSQGSTWKNPFQLSDNGPNTNAAEPAITTDSTGNVHVVWVESGNSLPIGGPDNDIFYSKWDGNSWSTAQLISDDTNDGDSISPVINVDMNGYVYVAWRDDGDIKSSGVDYDIVYRFFNGTAWSVTDVLSTDHDDGDSKDPVVATSGDIVAFAWSDDGNITSSGTDYDIYLRLSRKGILDLPLLISGDPEDGDSKKPALALNDTQIFVSWEDNGPIMNSGTDYDIILSTYNYAADNFDDFVLISDDPADGTSEGVALVMDNYDNLYIAWSDSGNMLSSGTDMDVFYRIIDTLGINDIALLTSDAAVGKSESVSLSVDYQNNVQFAWQDTADLKSSGTDEDIFIKDIEFNYIYPSNLKLDLGNDGTLDWNHTGILDSEVAISGDWLGLKLTAMVEAEKASAVNGYVEIPWKLSSDSTGAVNVSYVSMRGTRAPAAPVNLTILNEELLHVVDHNPVISWDFIDPDSETQGRFELEVGSSPGANDLWDPVPSESAETQIKYFGAGLIDGQPYFVRVRVADNEGSAWSDWSAPLEFRMNTPPLINSVTPSAGTFDENILLAWNGTDAEGDKLAYSVMIYYDDSWHTVVDNGPVTEFNWFTDDIVPQTIVINVYASDGYENSSKFEPAGPIYIGHNTPPSLRILSPKVDIKLGEKEVYLIEWNGTDDDEKDILTISLYYDVDTNETEKHVIVEDFPNTKKYQWDTTDVTPDEYYILGIISDGLNTTSAYSDGKIEVGLDNKILPPTIKNIEPELGASKIGLRPVIRVNFTKVLNVSSINHDTFYIKDSKSILLEGNREYYPSLKELRFIPKSDLQFGTTYTAVITHQIIDTNGLGFDGNYNGIGGEGKADDFSWSFSTLMKEDDNTPPIVLSTRPLRDAVAVDIKTAVQINFSESVDPTSLSARTFFMVTLDAMLEWDELEWDDKTINWLIQRGINGLVSYSIENRQAIFTPDSALEHNITYVVLLMPDVTDLSGNRLAGNYELITQTDGILYPYAFSFTTAPEIKDVISDDRDDEGPVYFTDWRVVYLLFVVILVIVILIITFVIRRRILMGPIQIRDVFLIYNDGRLLYHYRPKGTEGSDLAVDDIDDGAVSSMLTAIQDFVKDSFRFSRGSRLNELRHGMLRILIEHGNQSYVAVVCSGGPTSKIREEMKSVIFDLNIKYGKVLKEWDGNMNTIAGIDKLIVPLIMLEKDAELE